MTVGFTRGKMVNRVAAGSLLALTLACPIARPPVPQEYYDFRARLQAEVTDTAMVEMRGLPKMQGRLDARLPELAAIVRVDTLLAVMEADRELAPLAGAVGTTVFMTLESRGVGGGVRKAFLNRDGQRQAVDAIIIGLGVALRRVRTGGGAGQWRIEYRM